MKMYRQGMYRNYGLKTLLDEQPGDMEVTWEEGSNVVGFVAGADRLFYGKSYGKSSYHYWLLIEPQLILRALLEIPPDDILDALKEKGVDPVLLGEKITALVQGLAKMKTTPAEGEIE